MNYLIILNAEKVNLGFLSIVMMVMSGFGHIVELWAYADWESSKMQEWKRRAEKNKNTKLVFLDKLEGETETSESPIPFRLPKSSEVECIQAIAIVLTDAEVFDGIVDLFGEKKVVVGIGKDDVLFKHKRRTDCFFNLAKPAIETGFNIIGCEKDGLRAVSMIREIVSEKSDSSGWAELYHVGSFLKEKNFLRTDLFDIEKLSDWVSHLGGFQLYRTKSTVFVKELSKV